MGKNEKPLPKFLRDYNPYEDTFHKLSDGLVNPHILNSTKKSCCVPEAFRLQRKYAKGEVYWVRSIDHAYFILDELKLDEFALNQEDNGYEGFPRLTVSEVLEKGQKLSLDKWVLGEF